MPTFGDISTAPGNSFPSSNGRALVTKLTSPSTGLITSARIWFDTSTTAGDHFKALVFSSVSGAPGSLLASSSSTAIPGGGGWVTVTLSMTLNQVDYWVGYVSDSSAGNSRVGFDYASGGSSVMANGSYTYTSLPASWTATDSTYAAQVNVEVTYLDASTLWGSGVASGKFVTTGCDMF